MIFLDTSAVYALADRNDPNHSKALDLFQALLAANQMILTHNYVIVESLALIQNRLGLKSAIKLVEDARSFEIEWVEKRLHDEAISRLKTARKRNVSFVDQVSFLVMRARGVGSAFAFDRRFADEGFSIHSEGEPEAGP